MSHHGHHGSGLGLALGVGLGALAVGAVASSAYAHDSRHYDDHHCCDDDCCDHHYRSVQVKFLWFFQLLFSLFHGCAFVLLLVRCTPNVVTINRQWPSVPQAANQKTLLLNKNPFSRPVRQLLTVLLSHTVPL
jgi:hypothetical protein